jgi:hypothetical protein
MFLSQQSACVCGMLQRDADDRNRPVLFDAESGGFSLTLCSEVVVRNAKCRMCGGRAKTPLQRGLPLCGCGALERWLQDASVPVEYNTVAVDLFVLRVASDACGALALWFCPVCGGRAPDAIALSDSGRRTGSNLA